MPQEETPYSTDANCYAYAFDCLHPQNPAKGAVPGAKAGNPVLPGADPQAYYKALILGAIADARADAKHADLAYALPKDPPGDLPNRRLVALIAKSDGFHWLRRDPATGRWSWKDGNQQTVKLNIYDNKKKGWVHVTDANLADLLVKRRHDFVWNYIGMHFVAFLHVQSGGIAVAGPP